MKNPFYLGHEINLRYAFLNEGFRKARLEKGYSQHYLGESCGVSNEAISKYERLYAFPKKKIAIKIAEMLDKNITDLFPDELRKFAIEKRKAIEEIGKLSTDDCEISFIPLSKVLIHSLLFYNEDFEFDSPNKEMLKQKINELLDNLHPLEKDIIERRYALKSKSFQTLKEIGRELGLTGERVRQIEVIAITRLKHPSRSRKLECFLD